MNTHKKAKEFIYRNARPLDIARWQYHFENGTKEDVLKALTYYQNEDGGFGHALEPDTWNPNSSPIQTCTATEILREINFTDSRHPIIQGILKYLNSKKDFNGKCWANSILTNNDYPHAPWWHTENNSSSNTDYNPTACLAGFIIKYADKNNELFALGCKIAVEAYDSYMNGELLNDMHTATCFIRMMDYIKEANVTNLFEIEPLQEKLKLQVTFNITQEKAKWETEYICKPSYFFNSKDSIFYEENKEIAEYECEFIIKTQLEDGTWNIPWDWNNYDSAWAISKNWWKSNAIILNMIYLHKINKNDNLEV